MTPANIAADSTDATSDAQKLLASVKAKEDRRRTTSPQNGKHGGRPCAPCPTETATAFMRESLMTDGVPDVRHWRDGWYGYSALGWVPVTDGEMMKRLLTWLQSKGGNLSEHATVNYARNVLANLSAFGLCGIPANLNRPCWLSTGEDARNWMAFSNGVAVDVWKYAESLVAGTAPAECKRPVSADLFSTDFVSYPWSDEPSEPVLFLAYLRRVCPVSDVFESVRRMTGLMLADMARFEVFWQLHGKGSNGKTVLLDIIEALVGRQNVSRIPLESLSPGTRFQSFPLVSAKTNISGELATDVGRASLAAIEGELKHAVSGGTIEVERKGVDKFFERCRARFIMSANTLPTFMDKSDAIWRRLRIIPFDVQIPEEEKDVHLADKIIRSELPSILCWAMEGLADVIRSGYFPECARGLDLKEAHRATCDHEREFLSEQFEAGNHNDRISSSDVYEAYKTWMDANGYRGIMGAARFKSRIESAFPSAEHGNMRFGVEVAKGWKGIRRRIVADVAPSDSLYE